MNQTAPTPFEYVREDARRRIRITARQALQVDELHAIVDRQVLEDTWTYGILYDLRAALGATRKADADMMAGRVRTYMSVFGTRGPVALVTQAPDMIGAGQMYAFQSAMVGGNVEVFGDFDEAQRWLDQQLSQGE